MLEGRGALGLDCHSSAMIYCSMVFFGMTHNVSSYHSGSIATPPSFMLQTLRPKTTIDELFQHTTK